jgi:hypothetical protein
VKTILPAAKAAGSSMTAVMQLCEAAMYQGGDACMQLRIHCAQICCATSQRVAAATAKPSPQFAVCSLTALQASRHTPPQHPRSLMLLAVALQLLRPVALVVRRLAAKVPQSAPLRGELLPLL